MRTKVRHLEDENLLLKRLLRENGLSWQPRSKFSQAPNRVTRSSSKTNYKPLPHIPVEIQLRILSFALTSPQPIIDPLCKVKGEHLMPHEKPKTNQLAIHFLATCKAYHAEGTKFLWSNNSFIFTSPEAVRHFAEVDFIYREHMKEVTFRVIAKFYDDEARTHKISRHHHPDLKKAITLPINKRPKENTLARCGFRTYGWYQLVDFLGALLPPFDPSHAQRHDGPNTSNAFLLPPPPKLLPALEKIRIDFVNFGDNLFNNPPPQLHELASHYFGCTLNEVVLTGLPGDETGLRVSSELAGLLKNEGLLIDHAPIMVALKNGMRSLKCDAVECHYSVKVVRAMKDIVGHHPHDDVHAPWFGVDFPPAPPDEGEPPYSYFHSCRTMWKKIPIHLDKPTDRKWVLFDRMTGLPWDDIEEEATMFDFFGDDEEETVCDNCGEIHPGAIPPVDMMDLYDEF